MKSLEMQCLDFWRSKPRDEEYDYTVSRICALTQFVLGAGIGTPSRAWDHGSEDESRPCWDDFEGKAHPYPATMVRAVNSARGAWTFGAAADRLAALLALPDKVDGQ